MGLSSRLIMGKALDIGEQQESSASIRALLWGQLSTFRPEATLITSKPAEVGEVDNGSLMSLVVLQEANRIPRLQMFLEIARSKLAKEGTFLGCVETVEARKQRIFRKLPPGISHAFYADMPQSLEEICQSEERYVDSYLRSPARTQWRYFWKVFYNIVIKGARSS